MLTRAVRSATVRSSLGLLGEADRVGGALYCGACGLADATNNVGTALERLSEETEDGCHVSTVAGEFV